MSEVIGEGVVRIRADESGVDPSGIGRRAGDGYKKGFGGALRGLGGVIVGAVAAREVVTGVGRLIGGASDLNETISKTEVLFGDSANSIVKWSKTADTGLGQTQQQALDAAATFATFGKGAGLQGKALAGFSTELTGLATDLASFNNTSPEQAITAIGAALRGETEPIRSYGVLLDDASLRQEALRQGLIKTTSEALTPQQKVLAVQALLMKQTSDAQGDFARTSGGLANQGRILKASLSNIGTTLGSLLLPVATTVVTFINSTMIPAVSNLGPVFAQVGDFIEGVFGGGGGGALAGVTSFAQSIASQFLPVLDSMANTFRTVILPAVISLGTYLFTTLFPVFQQVAQIITTQVVPTLVSLATFIYGTLYPAVIAIVTAVLTRLKPVFEALVDVITTRILPTVSRLIEQFRTQLLPALQPLIAKIVAVTGFLLKLAAAILAKVLPPLLRLAGFIISHVVPAVVSIITWVVKVVNKILDWGVAVGKAIAFLVRFQSAIIGVVRDGLGRLFQAVADLPGRIIGLGARFLSAGKSIIGKFVDGLKGAGGVVADIAGNVWDAVRGLLNNAIDRINSSLSFTISLPGPDISVNPPDIPHLQSGTTSWRGGVAYVGEAGVERVWLPRGARVDTAAQTKQSLGTPLDFDTLVAALVAAIRETVGDLRPVQFVLPDGDPEAAAMAAINRLVGV